MPVSNHKSHPFPINDTNMPANYSMPDSEQKRPLLTVSDTNIPDHEQMTSKN